MAETPALPPFDTVEEWTPEGVALADEAAQQAATQAETLADLAETALWDSDAQRRGKAIHKIGLQRDSRDALAVLVEVATMDWDPANRYRAIQSIWSAAADGADDDGAMRALLEAAIDDDDESVAALAQQALDDLMALELQRAAIE